MAIWQQFPFTNFHQENLDWVLNNMKNLDERVEAIERHGGASKDYVDEQDALLDEQIGAERSARTQNDQMLQQQITAHTTTISQLADDVNNVETGVGVKGDVPNFGSLWAVVGDYPATQSIGGKLIQVQTNEQTNSRAIAGTGGTYNFEKGTIQSRLDAVEGALQAGGLVKQNGAFILQIPSGTARGTRIAPTGTVTPFDFAVAIRETATASAAGDGNSFALLAEPVITSPQKYTSFSIEALCDGDTTTSFIRVRVRTFVFVEGTTGDQYATVSYVDEKNAELNTELGNVEAEVQDAYTMAETADTNAASAKTDASKALTDSADALGKIGSKPAGSTFATLWETLGVWDSAVPMTQQLKLAYSWSWNNRSAINGTADYPTDKDPINARLTELEGIVARLDTGIKIARGNTMVYQDKQQLIDFQSAGFTEIPTIVASYSSTEDSAHTTTRSIQIFGKSNIAAVLQLSGASTTEGFPVDWIAIGK